MNTTTYTLHRNHNFTPPEFGQLAAMAHWGEPQDYTDDRMAGHFAAVDYVAHVRDGCDHLVGYVSAMNNGLGSVYIDGLLTHPEFDRDAIGKLLINSVLHRFPNHPVYAMPFVDEQDVFGKQGFKVYRRQMVVLANRNDDAIEPALASKS